ncbi:MAG TPA: hypothetical protein VFB96_17615 [Pirellulaceae bacterium]|jgi:hypothetical protein|nr:hypothetical protein [Pirellulaceae bacterium]
MGETKIVRYFLDIMAPGQRDRVLVQFSTTTPLQAIHVGDVLHSQSMLDSADSMSWLRVVGVVHRVWDLTDHISHLITVYTVAVSEREALGFLSDEQFAATSASESSDIVPMQEYAEDVSLEELTPEP